jgi:hypothetical protein
MSGPLSGMLGRAMLVGFLPFLVSILFFMLGLVLTIVGELSMGPKPFAQGWDEWLLYACFAISYKEAVRMQLALNNRDDGFCEIQLCPKVTITAVHQPPI